jgi:hypothetical protein
VTFGRFETILVDRSREDVEGRKHLFLPSYNARTRRHVDDIIDLGIRIGDRRRSPRTETASTCES